MISKLSNYITINLLKRNIIMCDEKELYDYGLFMIISYIVFFLISFLFGLFLNIPFASLVFYISFCLVRNFAGGVHANTELKCDIITTLSMFLSEIVIKFFIEKILVEISFVMLLISSICLCVIKPVAAFQKSISKTEQIFFHKKVILITTIILTISVISMVIGAYNITISFSVAVTFANILLIIGRVQQVYTRG